MIWSQLPFDITFINEYINSLDFPFFTVKHLNDGLLPVKAQNMFKVFKICILKGIIWFQNSLIPSSRRRRHRSL